MLLSPFKLFLVVFENIIDPNSIPHTLIMTFDILSGARGLNLSRLGRVSHGLRMQVITFHRILALRAKQLLKFCVGIKYFSIHFLSN